MTSFAVGSRVELRRSFVIGMGPESQPCLLQGMRGTITEMVAAHQELAVYLIQFDELTKLVAINTVWLKSLSPLAELAEQA